MVLNIKVIFLFQFSLDIKQIAGFIIRGTDGFDNLYLKTIFPFQFPLNIYIRGTGGLEIKVLWTLICFVFFFLEISGFYHQTH